MLSSILLSAYFSFNIIYDQNLLKKKNYMKYNGKKYYDRIYDVKLQVQQGSGAPPPSGLQGVGVSVGQQGMFMTQGAVGTRAGFSVGGVGSSALQGPLAYLEKTTSNIGMPEKRS